MNVYSTTKFQNINNCYKILLTVLQNHQRKETNLSPMSPEAFHFNNYIWLYGKHDVAIALLSKELFVGLSKQTSLETCQAIQ